MKPSVIATTSDKSLVDFNIRRSLKEQDEHLVVLSKVHWQRHHPFNDKCDVEYVEPSVMENPI